MIIGGRMSNLLLSTSAAGRSHLASTSRVTLSSPSSALSQVRHSHIGAAPLYLPQTTTFNLLPFPPHPNPARPLPPALNKARSVLVKGPLGELLVPLHPGVNVEQEVIESEEGQSKYNVTINVSKQEADKKTKSYWGMTRALLQSALIGVTEGHSTYLRLVGVGYRASIENDPSPPLNKLQKSVLPGVRNFYTSDEQEKHYQNTIATTSSTAGGPPPQRLVIRLGYSHPVHISIPRGITATVPQPTRIVLKGIDKDAIGLLAASIRRWRPPEPYKGKGVFVGDETIKLKAVKKK
ncbi:unnamed protein product [Sympodiomycopsis kandeliae]